jgi:hypothetical protein
MRSTSPDDLDRNNEADQSPKLDRQDLLVSTGIFGQPIARNM